MSAAHSHIYYTRVKQLQEKNNIIGVFKNLFINFKPLKEVVFKGIFMIRIYTRVHWSLLRVKAYLSWQSLLNSTAHVGHQCWKTTILSCHRCLFNTGVEKINNI